MIVSVTGLVRTVLAAGAGAGLVYAAMQAPGAVALGPSANADTSRQGGTSTVRSAALVRPGPELKGLAGLGDLPVDVTVAAAAAPERALTGLTLPSTSGALSITGLAAGSKGLQATAGRGRREGARRTGWCAGPGTQSLAAGLAAAQWWLVDSGDHRSLGVTACGRPGADAWLVAGAGGGATRNARPHQPRRQPRHGRPDPPRRAGAGRLPERQGSGGPVTGPHHRPARLDLGHRGESRGPRRGPRRPGPRGPERLLARTAPSPPAATTPWPPQRRPAARWSQPWPWTALRPCGSQCPVRRRRSQARALTASGPRALPQGGVIRVAGGTVRDISLAGLPKGVYGLQVRADVPIVAGAFAQRRTSPTAPGDRLEQLDRGDRRGCRCAAASSRARRPATRQPARPDEQRRDRERRGRHHGQLGKATSRRLTLAADTATTVDLGDAASVWVHRLSGKGQPGRCHHDGLDAKGELISVLPLTDALLRTTSADCSRSAVAGLPARRSPWPGPGGRRGWAQSRPSP